MRLCGTVPERAGVGAQANSDVIGRRAIELCEGAAFGEPKGGHVIVLEVAGVRDLREAEEVAKARREDHEEPEGQDERGSRAPW